MLPVGGRSAHMEIMKQFDAVHIDSAPDAGIVATYRNGRR
jgi:hypothetical protein